MRTHDKSPEMAGPDSTLAPRKQPTQARAKARMARVLDATHLLLVRDGPAAVTTPAIAAESGVSVGSIYQYFPNKEAIILALYEARLDLIRASAADAWKTDEPDWRAFFSDWIRTLKDQELAKGYDASMSAAFEHYPRLAEVEPVHAERLADQVVVHLKRYGSPWSDEALFDLAIHVYYLDAASWRFWTFANARLPQGVDRLVTAALALLAPALEGGAPPPPPYAARRVS